MNIHEVHTLCRHLRLLSFHQHVQEANSALVPLCWVGTVGEEDLQRRQVVVNRGVEEEVPFSLFIKIEVNWIRSFNKAQILGLLYSILAASFIWQSL